MSIILLYVVQLNKSKCWNLSSIWRTNNAKSHVQSKWKNISFQSILYFVGINSIRSVYVPQEIEQTNNYNNILYKASKWNLCASLRFSLSSSFCKSKNKKRKRSILYNFLNSYEKVRRTNSRFRSSPLLNGYIFKSFFNNDINTSQPIFFGKSFSLKMEKKSELF